MQSKCSTLCIIILPPFHSMNEIKVWNQWSVTDGKRIKIGPGKNHIVQFYLVTQFHAASIVLGTED